MPRKSKRTKKLQVFAGLAPPGVRHRNMSLKQRTDKQTDRQTDRRMDRYAYRRKLRGGSNMHLQVLSTFGLVNLSHSLSLSLYIPSAHTHTLSICLSVSLFLSFRLFFCLSLSLLRPRSLSPFLPLSLSFSLPHSLTPLTYSLTNPRTHIPGWGFWGL